MKKNEYDTPHTYYLIQPMPKNGITIPVAVECDWNARMR